MLFSAKPANALDKMPFGMSAVEGHRHSLRSDSDFVPMSTTGQLRALEENLPSFRLNPRSDLRFTHDATHRAPGDFQPIEPQKPKLDLRRLVHIRIKKPSSPAAFSMRQSVA